MVNCTANLVITRGIQLGAQHALLLDQLIFAGIIVGNVGGCNLDRFRPRDQTAAVFLCVGQLQIVARSYCPAPVLK